MSINAIQGRREDKEQRKRGKKALIKVFSKTKGILVVM